MGVCALAFASVVVVGAVRKAKEEGGGDWGEERRHSYRKRKCSSLPTREAVDDSTPQRVEGGEARGVRARRREGAGSQRCFALDEA